MLPDDYDDPISSAQLAMSQQIYYHGKITRVRSEGILKTEGQFLVRDSISKPNDYVLTAFWKGRSLHFQINRTKIATGRVVYHFEEEQFSTIPDLLSFCISHKKPITIASGCIISTGVGKDGGPLQKTDGKEIEAAYARVFNPHSNNVQPRTLSQQTILNQALRRGPRPTSAYTTSVIANKPVVPPIPSSLINRPLPVPIRSPRTSKEDQEDYCEMDYDSMDNILDASAQSPIHSFNLKERSNSSLSLPGSPMSRGFSSCQNLSYRTTAPPLPPRSLTPSNKECEVLINSTDYDEPRIKNDSTPKSKPSTPLIDDFDYDEVKTKLRTPDVDVSDYDELTTRLRDSGISISSARSETPSSFLLESFRNAFLSQDTEQICSQICFEDCQILNFIGTQSKEENGLRSILLPVGSNLRDKLIQRSRCMQLAVVISILQVRSEACRVVGQWIGVAHSLLREQANYFGFVNVMQGLTSKVLSDQSWIWQSIDFNTRTQFQTIVHWFGQLRRTGEPPRDSCPCLIPLLHPVLELFTTNSTMFNDESSFAAEIDSLWQWLEMARAWTLVADDMKSRAWSRYSEIRTDSMNSSLSQETLSHLLCDMSASSDKRFHPALCTIERLLQFN